MKTVIELAQELLELPANLPVRVVYENLVNDEAIFEKREILSVTLEISEIIIKLE